MTRDLNQFRWATLIVLSDGYLRFDTIRVPRFNSCILSPYDVRICWVALLVDNHCSPVSQRLVCFNVGVLAQKCERSFSFESHLYGFSCNGLVQKNALWAYEGIALFGIY